LRQAETALPRARCAQGASALIETSVASLRHSLWGSHCGDPLLEDREREMAVEVGPVGTPEIAWAKRRARFVVGVVGAQWDLPWAVGAQWELPGAVEPRAMVSPPSESRFRCEVRAPPEGLQRESPPADLLRGTTSIVTGLDIGTRSAEGRSPESTTMSRQQGRARSHRNGQQARAHRMRQMIHMPSLGAFPRADMFMFVLPSDEPSSRQERYFLDLRLRRRGR
jgi:hypothetical protein